jgi:dolichyl-phosphate-mannose--protein O-mannosyl transferase
MKVSLTSRHMRAYLITTAILFALLCAAHLWRVVAETATLGRDPWFIVVTILSAALSVWGFRLLRLTRSTP